MSFHRRLALALAVAAALALAGATGGAAPHAPQTQSTAAAPVEDRLVLALLEPERIASVDPGTGALATLQLPGGTLCHSPLFMVDGRILYVTPGRHGGRVMSIDLALRERPHWLANGDVLVPSAVPGHVWLGTRAPGPHGHWLVQDLNVHRGTFARPSPHRVPARPIVGAVLEGLVLQGRHGTFVWSPSTGRRTRATPGAWVLATGGSLIVSCGGRCRTLRLADGRRGRLVHAPAGSSFLPAGAALSPTGDRLAVALSPARRPRLALVDTTTGALRIVRGARLGVRAAVAFSPDGTRVYVAQPDGWTRAFAVDGRAAGTIGPRIPAPVMQVVASPATPEPAPVPRFAWLPAGWRQFTDVPALPGAPKRGSVFATSWSYRPAPHGPAGALPPGGVLVSARLLPRPRAAPPGPERPPHEPSLVLPALPAGELEGRPDVPEYRIEAVCGTRLLDVRVDVAAPRLGPPRREQVQRMLDGLVLPALPGGCRPAR